MSQLPTTNDYKKGVWENLPPFPHSFLPLPLFPSFSCLHLLIYDIGTIVTIFQTLFIVSFLDYRAAQQITITAQSHSPDNNRSVHSCCSQWSAAGQDAAVSALAVLSGEQQVRMLESPSLESSVELSRLGCQSLRPWSTQWGAAGQGWWSLCPWCPQWRAAGDNAEQETDRQGSHNLFLWHTSNYPKNLTLGLMPQGCWAQTQMSPHREQASSRNTWKTDHIQTMAAAFLSKNSFLKQNREGPSLIKVTPFYLCQVFQNKKKKDGKSHKNTMWY